MADDKEGYLLSRGFRPSSRLNYQHQLWRTALGYDLHPTILSRPNESSTTRSLRIADICTGTAIFLTTLSLEVPDSASLHGYDISADMFPHASSLPGNVSLQVMDAMSDPPEEVRGTYDIVHVRLLLAAVEGDDPGKVLRHARSLLKPGGHFQWDEMDPAGMAPIADHEANSLARMRDIFQHAKPTSWIARLPEFYQQNGFQVVTTDVYRGHKWQRHMFMEIWCLVVDDYATDIENRGEQAKAEQIRKLIAGAWEEVKSGAYYEQCIRVVVGRAV